MTVRRRRFGTPGWPVGEIGYGMWGIGGWSGSDDEESLASLQLALERGVNFFDTALSYGDGHSERLLARLRSANPGADIRVATKLPPKCGHVAALAGVPLAEAYPPDHIRASVEASLGNLGTIDLMQFHVWHDSWAEDESWQRTVRELKAEGAVRAWGVSVNRGQPDNGLKALATGALDSVQVVYNILDQAAADRLFPFCLERGIAVIARVPFDEGSLTGTLTPATRWPEGDWRNAYFTPERLAETLDRVARISALAPDGMSLPELSLRFILDHPAVATTIPGMRRERHVLANTAASDGKPLGESLVARLRGERRDA